MPYSTLLGSIQCMWSFVYKVPRDITRYWCPKCYLHKGYYKFSLYLVAHVTPNLLQVASTTSFYYKWWSYAASHLYFRRSVFKIFPSQNIFIYFWCRTRRQKI